MTFRHALLLIAAFSAAHLTADAQSQKRSSSDYLYLWSASADSTKPDFLAVIDARQKSGTYGKLVGTVPVPGLKNGPHHTEHAMPADRSSST
jgi:uncharacterized membrane protein (UPF0182 family)